MADKKRIYLCLAHMSDAGLEQKYIQEAFDTNWVVPLGPNVNGFEADLEAFVGGRKAVALSSCTAALHLALLHLGVGHGDEVLCQTFSFCASTNPVVYCGATPVFIDSDKDTWNMDPVLLEEAIQDRIAKTGKKPKAIIVVDLYGMPAQWDELERIGKQYDIPIIEDAANAMGSTIDPSVRIKGQENAYKTVVQGAVGGAAGVVHASDSAHTDCEPNANVEALRVILDQKAIEARPLWKPMHKQPVYKEAPAYVNGVSEALFKVGMCLPSGPYVSDEDVKYIVDCIKEAIV